MCVCVQGKVNVVQGLQRFLNKYGFRCINEQKLEENSLHDDPGLNNTHTLTPLTFIIRMYVI